MPWYEEYFGPDYWTYAGAEYTAARTEAEADYLAGVLAARAPGRRVLDLGCGTGRHAVALARRGFCVAGVDVSAWALERAAARAGGAGVSVELHRADLLREWPRLPPVDAVVCVQAFGWGSDAEQLRMLRAARAALAPGGILVLDHSNASAILRAYRPESLVEVAGSTFHFRRRYDAASGRSGGELRVRRPDGTAVTLPDDVRLYQPPEVAGLLERAGFEVLAVDADFTAGAPVGVDTRYVQFVAAPAVPAALPATALGGYRRAVPPGAVDLRWAPDEIEFVRDGVAAAWAAAAGPDTARRYDVTDPHGGQRAAPVLARQLGVSLGADQVTAGAGATGLLCALAGLAVCGGGPVLAEPGGHPELPAAAARLGVPVRLAPLTVAAVRELRPALAVLDRPGLAGEVRPVAAVRELAAAVADAGGVLVVDETCANYLPAAGSAAGLAAEPAPVVVVVLRSLSKGYCCGGLRLGFALAAPPVADVVRAACPPLAASALSLDVGLALLAAADPLAGLRARIAAIKPAFVRLLHAAGLDVRPGHPGLPWVTVPLPAAHTSGLAHPPGAAWAAATDRSTGTDGPSGPGPAFRAEPAPAPGPGLARTAADPVPVLERLGLAGKVVPDSGLVRLSVPLSVERVRAVEAVLGGPLVASLAGP